MMKSAIRVFALLLAAAALPAPVRAAMPEHPTLRLATLDGATFDLAAERGKWVIVNYWATWCVPCIKEMPDISRFVSAHADVAAIGVAYDDSEVEDIRAFLVKHPVSYPVAQVTMDAPPADFDVPRGLPTTWVIAPDGTVARHIVGPVTEAELARSTGRP